MRRFMILVLIAGFLWSGYWFVGKSAKYKVMSLWLNERRAAGWRIRYSDFRVVGFPNRFDSRFSDLDIFDPVARIGWRAPLFDILALSYQPNHIIAAFAHDQSIALTDQTIRIKSARMMASMVFAPNTDLAVRRIALRVTQLGFESSLGWKSSAGKIAFSTRQSASTPFAHEVVLDATDIAPTQSLRLDLDPTGQLPDSIKAVYLDAVLGFDAPWDRIAVEQGAPRLTRVAIDKMRITWGTLGLGGSGRLQVAKSGRINGTLNLEITNWRGVLALFQSSGVLSAGLAKSIKAALGLMTAGTSAPDRLHIPLTLANGQMSLGPVPLGPAPRLLRE